MKKNLLLIPAAILVLAACNNAGTGNANADTTTTTKTTTTTTTVSSKHRLENKNLIDIKTNKQITFRYDTIHYYYVDMNTNEQAKDYYFDPVTKDTFDYRGYNVNNSLILKDGDYTIDETRLMSNPYNVELRDMNAANVPDNSATKIKENSNSYKEKTDTTKLKVTDRKIKYKTKTPNQ